MLRLMAYFDDTHGESIKEVNALYFDGYRVSEKILEGLPIKVTIENGKLVVSADWPSWVNSEHMISDALEYITSTAIPMVDDFSTTPELDNADGFIKQE